MTELDALRQDLLDQQENLDAMVAGIPKNDWERATPSPGWSVRDQIGHLTYFDATAAEAITDPDAFAVNAGRLVEAVMAGSEDELVLADYRAMESDELLDRWRANRRALAEAARQLDPGTRVPWYGPSMGAKSFLTARLMEAWAHGTDVADALDRRLVATDRLRHIAQLGYLTRGWSYAVRGEVAPAVEVRLDLTSPAGQRWQWGPDDAGEVVEGPAEDFCLVVTQRRHLDDTALIVGPEGRHWLVRAQAFAGAPTTGPAAQGTEGSGHG